MAHPVAHLTDFSSPGSWSASSLAHDTPTSSKQALTELTTVVINLVNARDYENPTFLRLMSPDFRGIIDGTTISGIENHLERHKAVFSISPNYSVEPVDIMVDVDEQRGRAKVFATTKVSHYMGEVERLSVHIFTWKRLAGEWLCYRHKVLRGIQEFD